ncbi:MAG TPA: inositol monophosphatase family protein [Bacteroidales bacterium]|jgi:myo-inositol-1(or 4)-monophosphatase|nr:inositol monophosphatase [Bacteroidota bacterium]HJN06010.1 inositol monophosphatase family protein [Bacteroidales bacterium]|tara:strand:+ start:442 stop:1242 length:801 start_codon:yes stop_codon:yes gene_type:complete
MNLEIITKQVVNLTKAVGKFIKKEVDKLDSTDVEEKGIHNLVTYVDKESEKILVRELGKIIPEAGFIAEEDSSLARSEKLNWVIDPLDGTTNFIHRVPLYAISIALMDKNEIILGVIYEINLNECFYAWKNSSAFLNGKEINVSKTINLNNSLLATGFPYYDYSLLDPYLDLFKELMRTTRGVRRLGSAAVDLAYVACGRYDLFYEYGLQSWDVAAGSLIVKQAGGMVSDFKNKNNYIFGKQIIASNKLTHNEFIRKLHHFFKGYL